MGNREKSALYLIILLALLALFLTGCDLLGSGNGTFNFIRTPRNLLFVEQTDFSGSSEQSMTDMLFDPPEDLGATSYTLQQSTDGGTTWNNFQYYGEDLTTTETINDNFSIDLGSDCMIRLAITGGTYDGQYSNEVEVTLSTVDTYFSAWSISQGGHYYGLDDSGSGETISASFTVKNNTPDFDEVAGALSYQWYRLDPDDFEQMTAIPGATSASYTTTAADEGYIMVIRATGDGVNAGGYCQLMGPYIT